MEKDRKMTIEESIALLREVAEIEGSEYGEALRKLVNIYDYDYCFYDQFQKQISKEVFRQAKHLKDNYTIKETEEIIPARTITVKNLVEKD